MLAVRTEVICAYLECDQTSAELYINGFPVLYASDRRPICAESVHPFLIDGINTFELVVECGDTPSLVKEPHDRSVPQEASARAWLAGYSEDIPVFPDQGRRIADIKFFREHEEKDLRFPASFYASFDMGDWRGPMAWQDAPALRLDNELRQAAFATFRRLIQVHQDGDLPGLLTLLGPHIRDFTRIFGWSLAQLHAHFAEILADYQDDPDSFLPLREDDTDFRLVAHGRLIQCVNKDWLPTMRVRTPTGQILKKPVYLGIDGGALRVFR